MAECGVKLMRLILLVSLQFYGCFMWKLTRYSLLNFQLSVKHFNLPRKRLNEKWSFFQKDKKKRGRKNLKKNGESILKFENISSEPSSVNDKQEAFSVNKSTPQMQEEATGDPVQSNKEVVIERSWLYQ